MAIRHLAAFYGLAWTAVKRIDDRALAADLGPIDVVGVTVVGMDELAIQKGQRYATMIVDPRMRVLWVGRGRPARMCGRSSCCSVCRLCRPAGGGHAHECGLCRGDPPPMPRRRDRL